MEYAYYEEFIMKITFNAESALLALKRIKYKPNIIFTIFSIVFSIIVFSNILYNPYFYTLIINLFDVNHDNVLRLSGFLTGGFLGLIYFFKCLYQEYILNEKKKYWSGSNVRVLDLGVEYTLNCDEGKRIDGYKLLYDFGKHPNPEIMKGKVNIFTYLNDCYKNRSGRNFDENNPEKDEKTEMGQLFNILLDLKKCGNCNNSKPIFEIKFNKDKANQLKTKLTGVMQMTKNK